MASQFSAITNEEGHKIIKETVPPKHEQGNEIQFEIF